MAILWYYFLVFFLLRNLIWWSMIKIYPVEVHPVLSLTAKLSIDFFLITFGLLLLMIYPLWLVLKTINTVFLSKIVVLDHDQIFIWSLRNSILCCIHILVLLFLNSVSCMTIYLLLIVSAFLMSNATLACSRLFYLFHVLELVEDERVSCVVWSLGVVVLVALSFACLCMEEDWLGLMLLCFFIIRLCCWEVFVKQLLQRRSLVSYHMVSFEHALSSLGCFKSYKYLLITAMLVSYTFLWNLYHFFLLLRYIQIYSLFGPLVFNDKLAHLFDLIFR